MSKEVLVSETLVVQDLMAAMVALATDLYLKPTVEVLNESIT